MSEGYIIGGAGGATGATLTVNGVAGDTVTIIKDSKTYTRTFNADGVAVFKGLATGTWTATMTNGTQTSTREVKVTADYEMIIAYFHAFISVTFPEGAICTCSDGETTFTATDTSGSYQFDVPRTGTWTISCHWSKYNLDATESVVIAEDGEEKTAKPVFKLYLYSPGDQHTDITGGWSQRGQYGTLSFSATRMVITNVGDAMAYFGCTNFDQNIIADFKTLKVYLDSVQFVQPNTSVGFGVYKNASIASGPFPSAPAYATGALTGKGYYTAGLKTLDISNVQKGYPMICNYLWAFQISDIWLET